MPISPLRRVTAAAAVAAAGTAAFLGTPAAAQTDPCYPLRPDCVTTTTTPVAGPTPTLSATTVARGPTTTATASGSGPSTSGGSGSGGNLARTGALVIPTALVGLALVAGGAALKRSSRRGKSSTAG